jgi:NAD(P)-dependent dehydrogenase (short-subunit alcohol dehydrogenase family)
VFIANRSLTTPPLGVNLAGFFWLTQRAIAEMVSRFGGHVVNVSATIAEFANSSPPLVLAALTKGGLAAATRSLAVGTPPAASWSTHGTRRYPDGASGEQVPKAR